jgi:hypothetical protein
MKPDGAQIRELLEFIMRRPENRGLWDIPFSSVLREVGILQLDDLLRYLEKT